MSERQKPRHEMCVDKTSCKSEMENTKFPSSQPSQSSITQDPTGHFTKDAVKQQYIQSEQEQTIKK